jgi:hypothetical protein
MLGIAVAAGMLGATVVGGRVSSELAVHRALAHVPADQRATRVLWSGSPNGSYAHLDGPATRALAMLAPGPPARTVLYRETRFDNGRIALLAALDDLGKWVQLTSGRLPRSCTPTRCEVVQVAGAPLPEASSTSLHLVRVGTGRLVSALPFGSITDLGAGAGHRAPPATLISGDVSAVSSLPQLVSVYRTYAWSRPIDPSRVHSWDIGSLLNRQARALTSLSPGFSEWSISAPDQAVVDAAARSDTAGSRLTLVGGEIAALLLAFVLLAGTALRGDAAAERARLERRGARRGQVWAFALAEGGWIALGGVVLGVAAAVVAGIVIAGAASLPAGAVLAHSMLTLRGVVLALGALVVALALMLAVFLAPRGGRAAGHLADAVAVAALAALVLAAGRGATGADGGQVDPLLPLLPLLVALVAGVLVGRLLGPLMRLVERRLRGGSTALRIAVISVAREPLQAAIGAAFIAVALGLAFFAVAYRQTLAAGQVDQANFAVPADATVSEGAALVRPLEAAPISRYRSLAGGGTTALPVLRLSANAASSGTQLADVTALGVPAQALTALRWRGDTSSVSQAELARRLAPSGPVALRGPLLPATPGTLRLQARDSRADVAVSLVLTQPGGSFAALPMGTATPGRSVLTARLPARLAGARLVAVEIDRTEADSKIAIHQQGEGGAASGIQGSLRLGPLHAGSGVVTNWSGWVGRGGVTPSAGEPGSLSYAITGAQQPLLRPLQPVDGSPLPVITSPDIARAAAGGLIRLTFAGVAVPARVVAVGDRFPTVDGSFAVADESQLAAVLNADDPGSAVPGELWLRARPGRAAALDAALRHAPFTLLARSSHARLLDSLRSDPLSKGIGLVLEAAACVAVVLALAGLVLSVASAVRDDRSALFDLEAQGVPPHVLRNQLRLRAALVTVVGLVAALAIGAVLSAATVGLVRVTAEATAPVPPLERHLAWLPVAAGLAVFLLAAVVLVGLTTRAAFAAALPPRAAGDAP